MGNYAYYSYNVLYNLVIMLWNMTLSLILRIVGEM